jgi:diguanylate cyclase (GGDEF)-like protein
MGHKAGDAALISAVRIIKECVQKEGMVARIGGDEFVVLLPGTSVHVVMDVCKQIEYAITKYNRSFGLWQHRKMVSRPS